MIKMLIFDLDDTLLNREKDISQRTYDAIMTAHETGIKIGYNTARMSWNVPRLLKGLPIDAVSYYNGGAVYCEGSLVSNHLIPREQGRKIVLDFMKKYPDRKYIIVFEPYSIKNGSLWKDRGPCEESSMDVIGRHDFQRIMFYDTETAELNISADMSLNLTKGRFGETVITNAIADKGSAVSVMASYFNIRSDEIVAFGDDLSDFPMLRASGTGVAMENAVYEVKSAADYITKSCDEDGIAVWLEKHLLNTVSAV